MITVLGGLKWSGMGKSKSSVLFSGHGVDMEWTLGGE